MGEPPTALRVYSPSLMTFPRECVHHALLPGRPTACSGPALHCKPPIPSPLIFMTPRGFAVHRAGQYLLMGDVTWLESCLNPQLPMEGVSKMGALEVRDLSADLCCTTHWVTVLGRAPRRLTGFMSSTQRGVPTRAVSPVSGMIYKKIVMLKFQYFRHLM